MVYRGATTVALEAPYLRSGLFQRVRHQDWRLQLRDQNLGPLAHAEHRRLGLQSRPGHEETLRHLKRRNEEY